MNVLIGWISLFAGMITGAVVGLFFHRADWLGCYDAWPRRLIRLGHIAFMGTGLLNIAYAASAGAIAPGPMARAGSVLLALGPITMPTVCFLSAWREPFRHLFFIPVACLTGGVLATILALLARGGA